MFEIWKRVEALEIDIQVKGETLIWYHIHPLGAAPEDIP